MQEEVADKLRKLFQLEGTPNVPERKIA